MKDSELGAQRAGELVETALGEIAKGLRDRGTRRFVVAGGETSGAVVRALGVKALQIGSLGRRLDMSRENQLREEICTVGQSLYARGYTVGSAGNISARLEDGWLITPTDACLGRMDPARIAKVNLAGEWVDGDRPSKTLALHRQVYDRNPHVGGVVHTHSTSLVALTLASVWSEMSILPPVNPYQVMKVGQIPLIKYHRPGSMEVAKQVAELANAVRGVMLERLGPVVWESSVSKASFALEELEETAKLWLMTQPQPEPLDDDALAELDPLFDGFTDTTNVSDFSAA